MLRRACERALRHPLALTLACVAICYALVAPWGDYPVNDDWQYARAVSKWLETGTLRIDTPIAPALVGQCALVWPVVRLLGFSHLALRLCTLALAALGLWACDRILRIAAVPPGLRALALLSLGLNPYYFYFGATFMTEIYGYVPVLIAALVWLSDRERRGDAGALVSWPAAFASAALAGASFWIRQFAALGFPALLAASALPLVLRGERARLVASLPPLLASAGLWAAVVIAYFVWANATGNLEDAFRVPLHMLIRPSPSAWLLQPGICLSYLSACLAPLLVLLRWPRARMRRLLAAAAGLALVSAATKGAAALLGANPFGAATLLHTRWPFLHNILFNAGMGPITLADTYLATNQVWPRLSDGAWTPIELFVLALPPLWAPLLVELPRRVREAGVRSEALSFGLLLGIGSLAVVIQAFRQQIIDRYHFPVLIGFLLVLAVALGEQWEARRPRGVRLAACAGLLLALAAYDTAALHDHFRWQDARWQLVRDAIRDGIPPEHIEGGFEVDGTLLMDQVVAGRRAQLCPGGDCHCTWDWYCLDDRFRVAMNELPGYRVVRRLQPDYWLVPGPPLLFLEREGS